MALDGGTGESIRNAYPQYHSSTCSHVFDLNEDVIVSVDAEGLRACLLQGNQPVDHASRSLNSAERNYAQIEKEMLAILSLASANFTSTFVGKTVMGRK